MAIIFYTQPPDSVPYPYLLVNMREDMIAYARKYLRTHRGKVKSVLLDTGILIFEKENVRDYPGGFERHIRRMLAIRRELLRYAKTIYVVIPDYPDYIRPSSLWVSSRITNIERTAYNIVRCLEWFPNVDFVVPFQMHARDIRSMEKMYALLKRHGVFDVADYFAVPSTGNPKLDVLATRKLRRMLPDKKIHIFAPMLEVLSKTHSIIYSADKSIKSTKNLYVRTHTKRAISLAPKDKLPATPMELKHVLELDNDKALRTEEESIMGFWARLYTWYRAHGIRIVGLLPSYVEQQFIKYLTLCYQKRKKNAPRRVYVSLDELIENSVTPYESSPE